MCDPLVDFLVDHDPASLDYAAQIFAASAYVELTSFFSERLRDALASEVTQSMKEHGRRRELRVRVTGDSERRYRLAGPQSLGTAGMLVPRLYRDRALHALLAKIAGEAVSEVPYTPEEFIATRFERHGDTHGWHWDDYAFAMVWVLQATSPEAGGSLEFIRDVTWDKTEPAVEKHIAHGRIETRHPASGSVYLLRADRTLHRVTPLLRDTTREILCFSFAAGADFQRVISHETIELLNANQPAILTSV